MAGAAPRSAERPPGAVLMPGLPGRTEWKAPPAAYDVSHELVHVWRTGTHWPDGGIAALRGWLSADERQRSDRFHFAIDRTRYIIGHGLLRRLLGQCLGAAPDRLVFRNGAFGKPELAGGDDWRRPQFNISHSGEFVLVAVAVGRVVGIDIEQVRPDVPVEAIAKRFFSPRECAALAALDAPRRRRGFHACWTRKEAYIKARGEGLSLPLDRFDVSVEPDAPARLLATRPDPAEERRWTLTDLDVGRAHRAALAVERAGWRLRAWEWPAGRTD
jgi:4'-phosphopantetheinyl transferase